MSAILWGRKGFHTTHKTCVSHDIHIVQDIIVFCLFFRYSSLSSFVHQRNKQHCCSIVAWEQEQCHHVVASRLSCDCDMALCFFFGVFLAIDALFFNNHISWSTSFMSYVYVMSIFSFNSFGWMLWLTIKIIFYLTQWNLEVFNLFHFLWFFWTSESKWFLQSVSKKNPHIIVFIVFFKQMEIVKILNLHSI